MLLFLPYTAGLVLQWAFRAVWSAPEAPLSVAVLLLLLAGTSAYGLLIYPVLFLLFGALAPAFLPRLSVSELMRGAAITALLPWVLWVPAVFCSAYLGLENAAALLDSRGRKPGQRLRDCVKTSLAQLLLLALPAAIGRFFE